MPEQPVSPGLIGNRFIDPAHWSKVRPRPDDIVIATCYKAGTTLTQQIVRVLSTGADPDRPMRELSPWIDSGLFSPDAEAGADAIRSVGRRLDDRPGRGGRSDSAARLPAARRAGLWGVLHGSRSALSAVSSAADHWP